MLLPIIACEIGFWVVLVLALVARYVLRKPRTARALLIAVPLIDVLLLALIVIDLRGGAVADWSHGLGALYLGMSVAFGHSMVSWLDAKFARRFDGAPARPKLYGWQRARREWREFGKAILAGAISAAVLLACIVLVGDASRTQELAGWFPRIGLVLGIWGIIALSYTVWLKPAPAVSVPGGTADAAARRPR
ncbi:hypothetical protein [Arthrobacter sp. USHLN218]|uniref:hypothetical protein n=1 Tax=Arthrobacter sp. USHLN218 TaxID=3081232 RepID=UPI00301AA639